MQMISAKNGIPALIMTVILAASSVCVANSITKDVPAATQREPVVLLHGLGRSKAAMWMLAWRLEDAGYEVHRIEYDSLRITLEQVIDSVEQDIAACCESLDRKLHFVGHSMGGLLIRAYLERRRPENLGRVVLIGTPNQGTPLVDKYRDRWWMQFAGEAVLSLGTDPDSFPNSLPRPNYPFGVIAGFKDGSTTEDRIPGADDGLVPLDSTRLEGMSDFIVVKSGHSSMRYDKTVAAQVVYYLRHGQFQR